jgi:hypothetical protein
MPLNTSDIFLFIIFIAVIAIYDFLHRGILTTETLHTIIPENGTIYIILIIAFIYIRKIMPSDPSIQKLEKAILTLNNEINRMRTEIEWKSEIRSQGNSFIYYS